MTNKRISRQAILLSWHKYVQSVHSILQNGVDICTSFLPCPLHPAAIGACHVQSFTYFVPFPPIFLPELTGNYHFSRNFLFNFILAFQWSKLISDTLKHIGCSSRPQVSACTTSNSRFTNWSRWLFSSKCINLTSESHCLRNFQALQALLLAPQWVAIFLKLLRYDWQLTQRDFLSACFWITLPVGDMFLKQSKSVELPEDCFWRPRARYWDFSKGAPSDEF